MNERIKQLAEQSQKVVGHTDGGYTEIKALDQEKFAELIVRECAKVCRDQPNVYALKVDRDNCAIAIENHFGVKE